MRDVHPPTPESEAAFDAIRRANTEAPQPGYKRETGGDGRAGVLADDKDQGKKDGPEEAG
jgi:hypothetical protein